MRKLVLKMSMSLDGFVSGPNGEIDWVFKSSSPEGVAWTVEKISDASLHLMGSRTWRDMASWWPTATGPFAPPMNAIPKVVFTRGDPDVLKRATTTQAIRDAAAAHTAPQQPADPEVVKGWMQPHVAAGPMADEVRKLKQGEGRPLVAHGGAGFARSLIATGLIDEYVLIAHPVALGRGLPIFSDLAAPLPLQLVSAQSFPGGAVAKIYHPSQA